jgi:hypothetical protein
MKVAHEIQGCAETLKTCRCQNVQYGAFVPHQRDGRHLAESAGIVYSVRKIDEL